MVFFLGVLSHRSFVLVSLRAGWLPCADTTPASLGARPPERNPQREVCESVSFCHVVSSPDASVSIHHGACFGGHAVTATPGPVLDPCAKQIYFRRDPVDSLRIESGPSWRACFCPFIVSDVLKLCKLL